MSIDPAAPIASLTVASICSLSCSNLRETPASTTVEVPVLAAAVVEVLVLVVPVAVVVVVVVVVVTAASASSIALMPTWRSVLPSLTCALTCSALREEAEVRLFSSHRLEVSANCLVTRSLASRPYLRQPNSALPTSPRP